MASKKEHEHDDALVDELSARICAHLFVVSSGFLEIEGDRLCDACISRALFAAFSAEVVALAAMFLKNDDELDAFVNNLTREIRAVCAVDEEDQAGSTPH